MEIPLNAQVECTDGVCGRSVCVLINPVLNEVAQVVVKEDEFPNTEYMVPVEFISESIASTIQLRCSKAELEKMKPFIKTEYIEEKVPMRYSPYESEISQMGPYYYYMPFVIPESPVLLPIEHEQIPPGELAVHRGAQVEAADGHVGRVDEFVVNPESGCITHLVMREGHLWGQKDVIIPLSAIGEIRHNTVILKLDKRQIEALLSFPIHRLWP